MSFKERILTESFSPVAKGALLGTAIGGAGLHTMAGMAADKIRERNYKDANQDYFQQQEYIKKGLMPVGEKIQEVPMDTESNRYEVIGNLFKDTLGKMNEQ